MKLRQLLLLSLILVMVLTLSACGGKSPAPTATATIAPPTATSTAAPAQQQATATPVPAQETVATPTAATAAEPTPTQEEEVAIPDIQTSLEGVNSYRVEMVVRSVSEVDGEEQESSFSIISEADRETQAQRLVMEGTEGEGEAMAFEIITIGSDSWMSFGEGWMHTKSEEADTFDEMASDFFVMGNEIIDEVSDMRLVGTGETVNGIVTNHYAWEDSDLSGLGDEAFDGTSSGEIWVSQDGNYVVRMIVHAEGDINMDGGAGTLDMEWNLVSVNQPVDITPPEGMSAEDMMPVMENALTNDSYMVSNEMAMYEVKATTEEVLAWYDEALAAKGYEKTEEQIDEAMSTASYSGAEDSINIMIFPAEEEGVLSVMVTKEVN